ncbi:MAG: hypothetical protein M5T61_19515 [Acidimicrobiia bacterium]|nr:hypothetical protein [Acidimicrobiia bacterium]
MLGERVNAISVLGRELLLVDVGGGTETHLAGTADEPAARAAVAAGRAMPSRAGDAPAAGYDEAALLEPRWAVSTLCGRAWQEMAAGEGGVFRRWQEVSLAPTCRSCLRVVDTWFPKADAPAGIELLASVVAEKVEALGSAYVTGVPAEHLEAVRRAVRKCLRAKGFQSETHVANAVLHVFSHDAYAAIDPALTRSWINQAISRIESGESGDQQMLEPDRDAVDWRTWVVDG